MVASSPRFPGPTAPPDNLRQTINLPAKMTGPTPFTVIAETRTADGVFVPVPGARVRLDNFTGDCGFVDQTSALTNSSGVATFTLLPKATCLEMGFFVSSSFDTILARTEQVRVPIAFPVFLGDLRLLAASQVPLAAHLEEVTGRLVITSSLEPLNVILPNLKRVGNGLYVFSAVSVQLPVLESVGFPGLTVGGLFLEDARTTFVPTLTRFEAPALKQAHDIQIRDNTALRTLAIGPVKVQSRFQISRNGFPNFARFSSGIEVGNGLYISDNTGFSNQKALDFANRVTVLDGGVGVSRNTGP